MQIDNIKTYDRSCVGCKNQNLDVMISYTDDNGNIIDLYMKNDVALSFYEKLGRVLKFNKEGDV